MMGPPIMILFIVAISALYTGKVNFSNPPSVALWVVAHVMLFLGAAFLGIVVIAMNGGPA